MKRRATGPPSEERRKPIVSCPCCGARLASESLNSHLDVCLLPPTTPSSLDFPKSETSKAHYRNKVDLLQEASTNDIASTERTFTEPGNMQEEPATSSIRAPKEMFEKNVTLSNAGGTTTCCSAEKAKKETHAELKLFSLFYYPNKTVHLIRHGQTSLWGSVMERVSGTVERFDLRLTSVGVQQASALATKMSSLRAELILTSPLTRALQTLQNAFPSAQMGKERVEVTALHTEHVSCSGDVGRPCKLLAAEFPWLSFDMLPEIWWFSAPKAPNDALKAVFQSTEPMEDLRKRVGKFRRFLQARPENVITVIGHSTFFKELTSMRRRMKNCEILTITL